MSSVIYTYENGVTYVDFDGRKKIVWDKRWVKDFDLKLTVTATITHGSYDGALYIIGGTTLEGTIVPATGYSYPASITVTGATAEYNATNGKVTLTDMVDNVTITASCIANSYTITGNITNGSISGASTISTGSTATITITPSDGYILPTEISIVGATYSYNNINGEISLSNPTGNVTITATCVANSYTITPTLTNTTADAQNPTTISTGGTATLTFEAGEGYELPETITVVGATGVWTKGTGTLALSNPTANVTVTITSTLIQN